ncbi:jg24698, partial [Pararge aegeria aegeria]
MCVDAEGERLFWVNLGSATIQYLDLRTEKAATVSKRTPSAVKKLYT